MERLIDVLEKLKGQHIIIKEKGEIQWSGKAEDFNPYYYTTRNVVRRINVSEEKTRNGIVIVKAGTIVELD